MKTDYSIKILRYNFSDNREKNSQYSLESFKSQLFFPQLKQPSSKFAQMFLELKFLENLQYWSEKMFLEHQTTQLMN